MVLQIDAVQSVDEGTERGVTLFGPQLARPDGEGVPPHPFQLRTHLGVALGVAAYLLHPKGGVCLGYLAAPGTFGQFVTLSKVHMMSVPEASVDEDAGAVFPQHDVGLSGQTGAVDAIAESPAPQPFAHNHFGPCILRPDGRHIIVTLLGRMPIH